MILLLHCKMTMDKNIRKKLNSSIREEKESISIQSRLRKVLVSKGNKRILTGILKQERSHIRKLNKIKRGLK